MPGPEGLEIAIVDNGRGVPPENRELIFEKFQQASTNLTERPRGTGLGLTISRQIIEHFGGRIWVESAPGGGARFCVARSEEHTSELSSLMRISCAVFCLKKKTTIKLHIPEKFNNLIPFNDDYSIPPVIFYKHNFLKITIPNIPADIDHETTLKLTIHRRYAIHQSAHELNDHNYSK